MGYRLNMNLKRILCFLFSLICLSGFLFQVQQVSELYFQFATTSKTVFQIREVDHYQAIMYCPRSVDLFNKTYEGLRNIQNRTLIHEKVENKLNDLTIKDILELTPPENHIIDKCVLRQGIILIPEVMDRRYCETFFKITKSVIGERICYTFMPKIRSNFSVGEVASSKYFTNSVYTIYVKPTTLATRLAFFVSWIPNQGEADDPLDSLPYQAKLINHRTFNQSNFAVFGESTEIHRLAPPYDTKCTPGHRREQCYEQCLNQKFALINRVSWSGFHREKLDMKMVTTHDLRNKSTLKFLNAVFLECQSLCKTRADCFSQFSRTSVQEFHSPYYRLFSSMLPSVPHISVYAVPLLTLIEYIVQLGSCFGIWFGLSIVSLNPMKILQSTDSTSRLVKNRNRRLFFILSK